MIRVDKIWLAVEPMDMRAGPDTALARVIRDFGQVVPHHAYVFANKRANRMKILVHDGFGVWLAARRLNEGGFNWPKPGQKRIELTDEQVAIENELDALNKTADSKTKAPARPKRRALPPELPRIEIYHEPEELQCNCGCALKRIGEDVTEKLDYIPGKAQVERHIRGKWVCKECETLTQSPMPAHVIDKGLASHRLLAYVLVAKYADHLPLYRQQKRFAREGIRSEEHTSELQSRGHLVCRLLLEKKNNN